MEDPENPITVLCVGPKGSGKTTLMMKLLDREGIDNTYSPVPTVGTNIYDLHYLNKAGKKQVLHIREVGGEMAPLWCNYLDGIEKVVFVVDTSNLCQVSAAAVLLYTLLAEPRLARAQFLLVLSKMDAAYRQMRNEALLMLQAARLRGGGGGGAGGGGGGSGGGGGGRRGGERLRVLEASGMMGDGVAELRAALTGVPQPAG